MAFNPFHTFRKHQKVIFAVLTIICMIVFILQFGRGDILERLMGRGGQGKGEKVVTLYGRDLTSGDIARVGQMRTLVNQIYLGDGVSRRGAVMEAIVTVMDDLVKDQDARDKEKADKKDADAARDPDDSFALRLALGHWKQWSDQQNPSQQTREDKSRTIVQDLNFLTEERLRTTSDDVRRKIDSVASALRFEYWLMNPKKGEAQRFFFGGSSRTEDLLDFEIWKHQADRLGIVFTKDDVRKEVAWDAAGRDVLPKGPWKDDAEFKGFVVRGDERTAGPSDDDILNAIADEYRVSMAQTLLMGYASGVRSVQAGEPATPDGLAPFDFYRFYRNNRTTLTAAFLPLPVESFVDKVKKEPSEEDLIRLHTRYKDQLPKPDQATPGFKEPRRIKIEYVSAKADSDFYKTAANRTEAERKISQQFLAPSGVAMDAALTSQEAVQMIAAGAAAPGMGGAPAWAGLAYGGPQTLGREFLNQYNREVERTSSPAGLWVDPVTGKPAEPHDPTSRHPEAVVAVLGRVLGDSLTQAGGFTAPVSAVGESVVYEANDRTVRGVAAAFLGLGAGDPHAAALAAPFLPAPPPPAAVADQVFKSLRDERAPELILNNLNKFADELAKVKNDPEESRKYVAKAVKDFGFEYRAMERAEDEYELPDDPAIKPLKEALRSPPGSELFQQLTASSSGTFDPKRLSGFGVIQHYDPTNPQDFQSQLWGARFPADRYVFWLSEDERAHDQNYDQAREKVLRAWKFQEARKLALAEANRIDAEARAQASPLEAVKYLRDQKLGEVFELGNIARLIEPTVAMRGAEHPYLRYTFPENKVPRAPSNLLDRLMELDRPGKTLVFKDKPEKVFYVAVLEERDVPGVKDRDFLNAYADAIQPGRDQLWREFFLTHRQEDYLKKLLRQLREEAGPVDDKGNLVLSTKQQQKEDKQPEEPADNGGGNDLSGL